MTKPDSKPKLLYVVTEDWYFYSHRRPMARAAMDAGFNVELITNIDKHKEQIEELGITIHPFSFERRSLNPVKALCQILALRKMYKDINPNIIHHIAMKPILYGSIAALGLKNIKTINAFAGLGYVFSATSAKATIIRAIMTTLFKFTLKGQIKHTLFQNNDDKALFEKLGLLKKENTHIIKGSGVDLKQYEFSAPPERKNDNNPFIVTYAGRMISIKGLQTLKETFEILKETAPYIHLQLCGKPDEGNPESLTQQQLEEWAKEPNVTWLGHCENMNDVWKQSHAAIQLSYGGEGIPKSLIEAAACGKPIIASASAGCKDMVTEGKNGYLAPIKDAKTSAEALTKLSRDKNLNEQAQNSRKLVEEELAQEIVIEQTKQLYTTI